MLSENISICATEGRPSGKGQKAVFPQEYFKLFVYQLSVNTEWEKKFIYTVYLTSIILGHMNAALRQFSKPREWRYTRSLMSPSSGEN